MLLDEKLRRIAGWLALAGGVIGAAALVSAAFGVDFLRGVRFEPAPMKANAAFGLMLLGGALWLQVRGKFVGGGIAAAVLAGLIGLATAVEHVTGIDFHLDQLLTRDSFAASGAHAGRMPAPTALALALGATAVLALQLRRHRARWPLSAWLANISIALAVGALLVEAAHPGTQLAPSLQTGTHAAFALGLLGVGVMLARPDDKFVRMMFEPGALGLLARRLFFGAAVVPVILGAVTIVLVRAGWLAMADGVVLLTVGLIICGFIIALFSNRMAAGIQAQRQEAEDARQMLNARLQEQAAQLQEAVSRRTLELREANASLRAAAESNALLALVAEHTTNGIVIAGADGRVAWVNAAYSRLTGFALEEIQGRKPGELLQGPGTDPATIGEMRDAQDQGRRCHVEVLNYTKGGQPIWMAIDLEPVRNPAGAVTHFIALVSDITAQRAAQQRMRHLHERLALATRAAQLGVWEWDSAMQTTHWDARTLEIYGVAPERYSGRLDDWIDRLHPEDRARAVAAYTKIDNRALTIEQDFRIIRANDGAVRYVESRAIVQRDAQGAVLRLTGTERDVTDEREATLRAESLTERLRLALSSSNYCVWELDVASGQVTWDDAMLALYGITREEFDGMRTGWLRCVHPEDRERAAAQAGRLIAGEILSYDQEFRLIRPDNSVRHVESHAYLQRDAAGHPLRLIGLNRDITARTQLEERVRKSEELAEAVSQIALIGGWEFDAATRQFTWTEGVRHIHGVDDSFQPTPENIERFYPPESFATLQAVLTETDPARAAFDYELPLLTAAGQRRWVRLLGRIEFDDDGKQVRVHGAMQDVTVRHASEDTRRELETQLFQAQKMETLGTLAGGIAHDFNNLLTGIIGYHELAADSLAEDHPARACLAEARNASLRARELIEQILTFGRQEPGSGHVPLDLGLVAEESRRFLRATLPAMVAIELRCPPNCPMVLGDATQLHQVLLNLGSNAAHAMRHHGGILTIAVEPAVVTPDIVHLFGGPIGGSYVRLSVSDTGHGMDEATRRRIFDPFFTTKNTREGTGLGLAVVHGIVRSHRGAIDVESTPGAGATFHVYLPAATPESEAAEGELAEAPRGKGEFICIVDDEEVVGSCTKLVLESKGYTAVVYRSAEECLNAMHDGPASCALLITDQTMPGMQGTELVATIRKKTPALPVLIMSGYFSKISPDELEGLGQVELLAKPFTTEELTAAVHRALHPSPAPR